MCSDTREPARLGSLSLICGKACKMETDAELHVGDSFEDFSSLKWAVEMFEKSQKSNYWIRDCRTIEAAQKKGIKRPMKESLVYYNLTWACVKGGRSYDESIRSPRGDCGSYVKVAVSKDGQTLVVKDICTKHNHDTSQETFEQLPKQKRLSIDSIPNMKKVKTEKKDKVLKNPVKKLIQRTLMKKAGKVTKIKKFNSSNINGSKRFLARPRSLQDFVDSLRQSGDVTVEVIEDEKGNMKGIFWQDGVMRTRFDSYPELLIVGSVSDINRMKTSVVFQVIIDGNGETEVASVFLTSADDADTFTSLLNMFRNHNAAWLRTRTILSSKELKHRHVYRSCFPDASLHFCRIQVLEEMKRDITVEKMCASAMETMGVVSLLEKMARAQSVDCYDCIYDELQNTGLSKVMNYFNQKWHPLREEWVSGLKTSIHFSNETLHRLDALFDKVKDAVKKSSPLPHFCQDLQKALQVLQKETDDRTAAEIASKSGHVYEQNTVEHQFANFLTPYAFSEVLSQLRLSSSIKMDTEICDVTSPISLPTSTDNVMVSATSCSCQYFTKSWLPCRHIFAFRQKANLCLFFEDIAQRWHLSTIKSLLPVQPKSLSQTPVARPDGLHKGPSLMSQPDALNPHFRYQKPQVSWPPYAQAHMNGQLADMSQAQKFESLLVYAQRLAQLGSDAPMGKFVRRRETLSRLVESWERGDDLEDESLASNAFVQTAHIHQEDLGIHTVAQSVTNQIQSFPVHGPSSMPDNHHMGAFVAKERPYHIYHQQPDHSSHNMGMMEHIPTWSHIVL